MSDDFDRQFKSIQNIALAWMIFVILLSLAMLAGSAFVIYKLLVFFGVL